MDNFQVWGSGIALLVAALAMIGLVAASSESPLRTFVGALWFPGVFLILPILSTVARFLADLARVSSEHEYWRRLPQLEDPAADPAPAPTESDELPARAIAYNVMGKPAPALTRADPEQLREARIRQACLRFLQAGHAIGDRWGFRDMKAAGLIERLDWDAIVGILRGAGLLTSAPGEGTYPYPDYPTALDRLRAGHPLPTLQGEIPNVARVHSTAQHSTGSTGYTSRNVEVGR